jgi:hypothetical protein
VTSGIAHGTILLAGLEYMHARGMAAMVFLVVERMLHVGKVHGVQQW